MHILLIAVPSAVTKDVHFLLLSHVRTLLLFQAVDDDGEDSASGSANSLIMEDQTDGSYLVSTAINNVGSAPSPITTSPWAPDQITATTNTITATNILANTDNSSVPNNSIPVNSSTSASDSVLLPGGGVLTGKVNAQEEKKGATTPAAASVSDSKTSSSTTSIIEWFTQGSLVKSKLYFIYGCPPNINHHHMGS